MKILCLTKFIRLFHDEQSFRMFTSEMCLFCVQERILKSQIQDFSYGRLFKTFSVWDLEKIVVEELWWFGG